MQMGSVAQRSGTCRRGAAPLQQRAELKVQGSRVRALAWHPAAGDSAAHCRGPLCCCSGALRALRLRWVSQEMCLISRVLIELLILSSRSQSRSHGGPLYYAVMWAQALRLRSMAACRLLRSRR